MNKRIIFSLLILVGLPLQIAKAKEIHYGLYGSESEMQEAQGSYCTYRSCHTRPDTKKHKSKKLAESAEVANVSVQERYSGFEHVLIINPQTHRWYAYDGGRVLKSGVAAAGKSGHRTPTGVFHVQSKGGADCRSSRYPKPYGGARMDYCMFFTHLHAVHGSGSVPADNVSHGCVRVTPTSAQWLSSHFVNVGTKVIVRSY
jgi:lipoprotein-anchoring transpeptidase ErfK/SrfK